MRGSSRSGARTQMQAAEVRPAPSFHGLRVWAVDGSEFNVPDTEKYDRFFGRPKASRGSTAFPQLHLVTLVDATTRQTRGAVIQRCNGPDRDGLLGLLDKLGAGRSSPGGHRIRRLLGVPEVPGTRRESAVQDFGLLESTHHQANWGKGTPGSRSRAGFMVLFATTTELSKSRSRFSLPGRQRS
jgi:hypothetical protein